MNGAIFFLPVKRLKDVESLQESLESLSYDEIEESLDSKSRELFRLKLRGAKIGIIVIMNQALKEEVNQLLKGSKL